MVENSMFYPLKTVGEFEPFVNLSTTFSKNLEMWIKMRICPPLKRAPWSREFRVCFIKKLVNAGGGEVNANCFIKNFNKGCV